MTPPLIHQINEEMAKRRFILKYVESVEKHIKEKRGIGIHIPTLWDALSNSKNLYSIRDTTEFHKICLQTGLVPSYLYPYNHKTYFYFDLNDTFKLAVYLANI